MIDKRLKGTGHGRYLSSLIIAHEMSTQEYEKQKAGGPRRSVIIRPVCPVTSMVTEIARRCVKSVDYFILGRKCATHSPVDTSILAPCLFVCY